MNLLTQASKKFAELFPEEMPIHFFRDSKGVYCIETRNFILVAKKYIFKNIVSAHAQAVYHAWAKNKKIAMFIAEENRFLFFDPEKVLAVGFTNKKGKTLMFNFKVEIKKGELPCKE